MQKKVSIIIPFYSGKEWLKEALESVFNQTFKDYEVILVNDGSKEDVSDIIVQYKGRINYFEQINQGPAAARNLGISKATGKYIAFEDSDDIWMPTKLEKQVTFMEKLDLMWSHTGFNYWWPESNKLRSIDVSRIFGDINLQCYISIKIATPCVMINREFLLKENLWFPENKRNGEDSDMWGSIAKLQPIGLVQEPLVNIRMRGSNSYSHAVERFQIGAEAYNKLKLDSTGMPKGILRIKRIYYIYSKLFKGKVTPFKEFLAKCMWTVPYAIERVYVKKLIRNSNKDDKYIERF